MRIFAIGDIHGHYDELQGLLDTLWEQPCFDIKVDHLVLLGDLVDSGKDSRKVVQFAMGMKQSHPKTFHPLRGNHDDMLVDALRYDCKEYDKDWWLYDSGYADATATSYMMKNFEMKEKFPKDHLDFLEALPTHWETDNYFFCHAGVRPGIPLEKQSKEDLIWIRHEFYKSDYDWGKKIIFAHTPFTDHTNMNPETNEYEVYQKDTMIGINTMPRNEGKLTCVMLPDEKFFYQKKWGL